MKRTNIHRGVLLSVLAVVVAFSGIPLLAAVPNSASTNQLQAETVSAWDEYIRGVDSRMQARFAGGASFLWIDESKHRSRRIVQGEVLVAPVLPHGTQSVPNGLIHHWIGGISIPGAAIDSLVSVTQNYSKYKEFYKPVVADSRVLGCTERDQTLRLKANIKPTPSESIGAADTTLPTPFECRKSNTTVVPMNGSFPREPVKVLSGGCIVSPGMKSAMEECTSNSRQLPSRETSPGPSGGSSILW